MKYQEAKESFQTARNKEKGKVMPGRAGQTRLVATEEGFGIKYVNTVVVEFLKSGDYRLNTDGWRTPTTKERINQYAPVRISQRKSIWYLEDGTAFEDGMIVGPDGTVKKNPGKGTEKKQEELLKRIKKYVDGYGEALKEGKVPVPSGGDCWGCAMLDTKTGKTVMGTDHLIEHMKEKYYVPSLLVNALRDRGYKPEFVNPWNGLSRDISTFKRVLSRYLKAELTKAVK